MKMNEKQKALYDAVSGIDAALVQEATASRPAQVKRTVLRFAAAAAMVAILIGLMAGIPFGLRDDGDYITAPGLLSIYANAAEVSENIEEILLDEGVTLPATFYYRIDASVAQVLPITLSIPEDAYPNKEITFEINAMDGIFSTAKDYDPNSPVYDPNASMAEKLAYSYYGQHFSVPNNTKMEWTPFGFDYDYVMQELEKGVPYNEIDDGKMYTFFSNTPSYIDITIRADKHIVGYAVIEISEDNGILGPGARNFTIKVLKIVSFPLVNGRFQRVTAEYVQDQMKALRG